MFYFLLQLWICRHPFVLALRITVEKKIVSTLSSTDCIPNMSPHKYLIQIMFLLLARLLNWYFSSFCPDSVLFCCCSEKTRYSIVIVFTLKCNHFYSIKRPLFKIQLLSEATSTSIATANILYPFCFQEVESTPVLTNNTAECSGSFVS